jgi:heptosyltransferase-2
MSVPAMRALRHIFPDADISLHTRSWAEGIFRDADFIDHVLVYERPESSLNEVVEQARRLRSARFDVAVLFPGSFASALTARFAGIPRRFGFSRDARGFFLTDAVAPPEWKNERHEVYYYLRLVEEVEKALLGTDTAAKVTPSTRLSVSDERQEAARDFLSRRGFDLRRPVVAIGAGSTNSRAKRWPVNSYAGVVNRLCDELSAHVILLGDAGDSVAAAAISELSGRWPLDLSGKTSLADAAAILNVSDLLIANDMGLAHVAPAVGTRTIVIFGPTDPVTTRPFSELAEVVREDVECSPCMLRDCPIDHRCMSRISEEVIFEKAREILLKYERNTTTAAGGLHRP